ncbi:MAG: AAA family ATPase, partial [Chloroflexi bacterium]|nr:AAA family ATPase [Chloroflexota bacterium]
KPTGLTSSIQRALNGQEGNSGLGDEPLPEVRRDGTIVTIFGAKGGVGKTMLAVNLAASMAKAGASPVIVDLDSVFGDVAKTLRLTADKSFVDAAQRAADLDQWTVDKYLFKHPSGVQVLPAPIQPTDWREIDPKAVDRLLSLLAQVHDIVIIDTPATFTDLVVQALRRADIIFLVSSLEANSIDDTSVAFRILGASPADRSKIRLTLNHQAPNNSMSEAEAAEALGEEAFWSIPYDERAGRRNEAGMPIVLVRPRAKISRRISSMAKLLGELQPVSQKS